MIFPSSFESKLGFEKIRTIISELCATEGGREILAEVKFSSTFAEVEENLVLTNEMKTIINMENSFPGSGFSDFAYLVKRIRIEGTFLEAEELLKLRNALGVVRDLALFFKREEAVKYPRLKELAQPVSLSPVMVDKIDAIVTKHGKVKDNASPDLQSIRRSISEKQSQVSKRLHSILKAAQADGYVDEDATISIREGRAVIPIPAGNKRKLKGLVLGESATGKTFFIEPVEVVELNNELRELEFAERREVIKILTDLANFLRPYIPELLDAALFLSTIDFIRAKGLFAIRIDGIMPLLNQGPKLEWTKARHPLLEIVLKREKKPIVPLNIPLSSKDRLLIISGPNAGGKSVCLKTVGLLQYMLQCGFLVPMSENSEMGIFQHLLVDIGDEQSLENDLSTYSSHLMAMKAFLRYASPNSLILIDEFGTGTEPALGGAIAESILEKLAAQGSWGVITTHYTNLKLMAGKITGIQNGAMLFDVVKIQPLFQLETGKPGSSFAFEIAHKIGLPDDVLAAAREKAGTSHIDFEKQLRAISRDKRYWEEKRSGVKNSEKRLEQLIEKYETELSDLQSNRKLVVDKAKQEAKDLLSGVNKQIENTIRTIKEANAEKVKTKTARQELEEVRSKVEADDSSSDEWVTKKMEQLQARQKRKSEKPDGVVKILEPEKIVPNAPLQKGDKVRLIGRDTIGEVYEASEKNVIVAFGSMLTTIDKGKVERISNNEYKQAVKETKAPVTSHGVDTMKMRMNFSNTLDVRGMRGDATMQAVQEYIDEAVMLDISDGRILHGKGNGILRELIRSYLKTIPDVSHFADEQLQMGGSGITVIKFR
ncbi:endonuclease MutS2 [Williamwhitmania taraxaci]|uniref:Endonuclease MutS2 n=1 Tax=Williamwhitmania taraxaci TaxID=1640674 RepID=A0A1G6K4Z4_9BACT|nr:Smr/MutS family protein [Williamwhitmania taraxaci]SDC25993.1 DNA mismatch repair protein MutS2 [Williamwhitmania taraxaci]